MEFSMVRVQVLGPWNGREWVTDAGCADALRVARSSHPSAARRGQGGDAEKRGTPFSKVSGQQQQNDPRDGAKQVYVMSGAVRKAPSHAGQKVQCLAQLARSGDMLLRRGRDQRRRTTQGRIPRNRAIAVAPVVEAMVKVVVFLPSWPANNSATRAGDAARILYSALAWPVTTLVIVAILRGPITELLRAIGQ